LRKYGAKILNRDLAYTFSLIARQGDFTTISIHGNLSVMPIHQDLTTHIAA